jgi:hypothetical protein
LGADDRLIGRQPVEIKDDRAATQHGDQLKFIRRGFAAWRTRGGRCGRIVVMAFMRDRKGRKGSGQ